MGKSVREPLEPTDLFSNMKGIEDTFFGGKALPKETSSQTMFSPKDYEYVKGATPFDDRQVLEQSNIENQPFTDIMGKGLTQFGANFLSSVGQGLANTFDLMSNIKTAKGLINGTPDDFNSSLFGVTTRDMQAWANGIAERNQILEKNPDSFSPSDPAWWGKQFASAGTGVGMGVEALGETAAIEFATGGMGTGVALGRLGNLIKNIGKGAKGAEVLSEAFSAAKGMRSAATVYGVMNRLNESRMEATNSYDEIAQTLANEKDENGIPKYSHEKIQELASAGARRDYAWNLALLPLDILSYRTIVFNPISGSGTGLLEKGLAKVAGVYGKSALGKAAGWTTEKLIGSQFEGFEEGFQQVGSDEGKHYAQVLGGIDDGSNFVQRFGKDIQTDEFWNNYAGGVIGSPIIGGVMNLVNKVTSGNRAAKINAAHKYYVQQVGKMDNVLADEIKNLEESGDEKGAAIKRRQFGAAKALSALHLDASTDKDTAFDSRMTFLTATLGELNSGKTDALGDLGFFNLDAKALDTIKAEFKTYIDDANKMKKIYDDVKTKYNKNFVPAVANDHFKLEVLLGEQAGVDTIIAKEKAGLSQYNMLSSHGKEIYDTEFHLRALNFESTRLADMLQATDDSHEKNNIKKLIQQNDSKKSEVVDRIGELNKDDTYTASNKDIDADIINSSLRSRDYQQAIYDKVHLDNAISLQRKNIALWNNKEYLDNKAKQSISKAKTKEQVQNNVGANVSPVVAQAVIEKENEIEAASAAEDVDDDGFIGNQDMDFDDDSSFIDEIKQHANNALSLVVTNDGTVEEQDTNINSFLSKLDEEDIPISETDRAAFEPNTYDFNKSSDEAKNGVRNGVRGLLDKLGDKASFEDLVRHVMKVQGRDTADKIYNALKYGWEANGKEPIDYDAIYRNIFGNPMDELLLSESQLVRTDNQSVVEDTLAHEEKPDSFDNNNQPQYVYKDRQGRQGYVTSESSPKFAFVTIASKLIRVEKTEENTVEISHEYTDEELNQGDYVNSTQLLDPDKFIEGTELVIKIPVNFMDIKIPIFKGDGTKGTSITFGQHVSQNNLSPSSQEYQDKIPIIIYRKGVPTTEKGVAFVHDIGWYTPNNFNQASPNEMLQAINSTRDIRKQVLNSPSKSTTGKVTSKRQTTFSGLKVKTPVTLRQGCPDAVITVVGGDYKNGNATLSDTKGNIAFPTNEKRLTNSKPFLFDGQVVDVRRFGTDSEGVNTYVALHTNRTSLDNEAIESIVRAITIYDSRLFLTPQQKAVVEHIKTTMGTDIDITASPKGPVAIGLKAYLSHFIKVFDPHGAKNSNQDIERLAKANLAYGTPYISFIDGGNIVIGQAGKPIYTDSKKKAELIKNGTSEAEASEQAKVYSVYINPSIPKTSYGLSFLNQSIIVDTKEGTKTMNRLNWYEQSVSLDSMATNKPIVTIDKEYASKVTAPTYKDYLLDHLTTDIKSINIGTENQPNYVTNIQPIITYDTDSNLSKTQSQSTNQEIKEEIIHREINKPEETDTSKRKSIQDIIKEEEERASKKLGTDRKNNNNEASFEPNILREEQRIVVAKSIERIAGLSPEQQSTVTNFIFNQIIGQVNLETTEATKESVDRLVESVFDKEIVRERNDAEAEVTRLKALLIEYPELQGSNIPSDISNYETRIAIIDSIKDQFEALKAIAYEKVKKNTGITQNKQVTEREEGENDSADETVDRTIDFYTDVLTESPENKLSYAMRRFFGQTRKHDKEGKPMVGFLNLPLYEDASSIIRTLMTTLVDIPADFDAMIAKLEDMKQGTPWMQDILNRLGGTTQQRKNQFVTVMHNTSLRMKFSMIGYDRYRKSWNVKLMDATLNGIAATVKQSWYNNILGDNAFNLLIADDEGNQILNTKKAESLVHRFQNWTGVSVKNIEASTDNIKNAASRLTVGKSVVVEVTPSPLLTELKANIIKSGNRMKFTGQGGYTYQIKKVEGGNKYQISFIDNNATDIELTDWLREFGIVVNPDTMKALRKGDFYHNYKKRAFGELFQVGEKTNGLFGILYNSLTDLLSRTEAFDFTAYGNNPLDNSVITSLANEEAKHTSIQAIFGFRVNKKSYFALTSPSFISDRARDLKDKNSSLRDQLQQISFSQPSLWLTLLQDEDFRDKFSIVDDSAESLKQTGKKSYRDANLTSLSDMDHELSKISKFQDSTQGEVRYGKDKLNKYPDTGIALRMSTMFGLTMSDKDRMKLITTAVLDLGNTHLANGIHDEVLKVLYEQTVKPELLRMIKYAQNTEGGKNPTNVSGYDKGASIFLMIPEMNNIMFNPNLKLVDAIKNQPMKFNSKMIENNEDIMKSIKDALRLHIEALVVEKLEVWNNNGYITKKDGAIDEIKFFDKKYLSKFNGTKEEQLKMAAADYEINSLVANANNFMILAGDPALYFKSKSNDYVQQAKDTFVNVNKRLANQVAPGITLPGSEKEIYFQIFMNDREGVVANNIDYLERILGKEGATKYRDITVTDAQEYTTWKEHLDILNRMGKSADFMFDITPEEIVATRALMASGIPKSELNDKQLQMILKVMQPIKPVYTGQVYDKTQDLMRTMYIKSSSFPLIPQLTAGLEIDKLRIRMEEIQTRTKQNVRASYQSGNKVGALLNAATLWNEDGTMNDTNLKDLSKYMLSLDRKNFRIQQEVPFKSDRSKEDVITLGTQLMKLLFGDEMMNQTGFTLDGEPKTGKQLHEQYTKAFIGLVKEKQLQLYSELGLDDNGVPTDVQASMKKLQTLLENEAKKRGYPLQDIKGLEIDANGNFSMPLWASTNSNRYESMLNAIVAKRMIAMKFPGSSFVTGSEEGFKTKFKEESKLTKEEKSGIIYTSAWNGKGLEPNQVFVPSKFRGHDGNLLDLLVQENGKYKYVKETDKGFELNEKMFDKELLQNLTFRIPTSGHQSGSLVHIAGFLPHTNGDLIIVSKNSVVQKGLDFDVDKENAYQLWTHLTKDGKFEILQEKHRTELLADVDKLMKDSGSDAASNFMNDFVGDMPYNKEEIEGSAKLKKANSKISEKLLHNEIIKITHSVYANQSDEVQAKVARTVNTKYAEDQANYIDGLISQSKPAKLWTPLSSEHQKQTLMSAASGKIGTGAYSLDVVFHSLAQQANNSNNEIKFFKNVTEDTEINETTTTAQQLEWRFDNIVSNGVLGRNTTIDGSRTISEVMSERQNVAVDNAVRPVMGKVNLNDLTLDVDKVFNMLGIDKGIDGNSIPFLFLSQPIIREYVERMKNANSIMADYEENKEQKIIDALLVQYDSETKPENIDDKYWELMSNEMSNKNFITALSTSSPDGKLQGAVLRRFIEMKQYGAALRGIQTTLNFKNNSFGKSFFDVIEKKNKLNALGSIATIKNNGIDIGTIEGQDKLIGDYYSKSLFNEAPEGTIDIGDFYVRPTTVMGGFNIHATITAYNLWNKYFPYDTPVSEAVFDEILPLIGNVDSMSSNKTVELKQDIFRDIRKYLAASKMNGVMNSSDDVNKERHRLFIDTEENTSLAKYMKTLMQTYNNPAIDTFIKTNKLINRFEYALQKNGLPSLIKYNNAAGEEFDEQYLYEALSTLIEPHGKTGRVQLPTIGNKSYTLDTLAQDLIAYCFLGNATQEAIQFTKYVPVAYLNTTGYSEWLKNNSNTLGLKPTTGIEGSKHLVSEYTMQYIQHNPGSVKYRLTNDNFTTKIIEQDSNDLTKLHAFKLKTNEKPTFVSIYNPMLAKGENKYQLYWLHDGEQYTKVPVLGFFGMDEYQPDAPNNIGQSIVNGRVKIKIKPQSAIEIKLEAVQDIYDINSGNLANILQKVQNTNIAGMSELAKAIAPYIGNTQIGYAEKTISGGARAEYIPASDRINITTEWGKIASGFELARTILHETVHSLTMKQIQPYVNQNVDGSVDVNGNAPAYVSNLVRLYNDVRAKSDTDELKAVLERVKAGGTVSPEEYDTKYGLTNIYEFMTMSLTHPEFQKYLSKTEFKQSGQTLLDRFKDIIKDILNKLGVRFENDTAAAQAINSIFQFIEESNKTNIEDVYKKMADDAMNEDTIPPLDEDDTGEGDISTEGGSAFEPSNIEDLLKGGYTSLEFYRSIENQVNKFNKKKTLDNFINVPIYVPKAPSWLKGKLGLTGKADIFGDKYDNSGSTGFMIKYEDGKFNLYSSSNFDMQKHWGIGSTNLDKIDVSLDEMKEILNYAEPSNYAKDRWAWLQSLVNPPFPIKDLDIKDEKCL